MATERLRYEFSAPSTTITAAALTGMGITLITEVLAQAGIELRPTLSSALTTFFSSLVGYLVVERRYGWDKNASGQV